MIGRIICWLFDHRWIEMSADLFYPALFSDGTHAWHYSQCDRCFARKKQDCCITKREECLLR